MARGVIFDVDGTLIDSNDAHAHAWVDALCEYGHDVDFARIRPLIGMGGDKLLPEVIGVTEDSPEGKAIIKQNGFTLLEQPVLAGPGKPPAGLF